MERATGTDYPVREPPTIDRFQPPGGPTDGPGTMKGTGNTPMHTPMYRGHRSVQGGTPRLASRPGNPFVDDGQEVWDVPRSGGGGPQWFRQRRDPLVLNKTGTTGIRPGTYDGTTPWEDYLAQFEVIAELHDWGTDVMALCLVASLRGDAQAVVADLDARCRRSYTTVVGALSQRFSPTHQKEVFRVQLKSRLRRKDESLPELAHEIKRLTRQAYPMAPGELQAMLAKDHFLDALDDPELRLGVYQMKPVNLEEAVKAALEIEAYHIAERQRSLGIRRSVRMVSQGNAQEARETKGETMCDEIKKIVVDGIQGQQTLIEDMRKALETLNKDVSDLKHKLRQGNTDEAGKRRIQYRNRTFPAYTEDGTPICFQCKEPGHMKRECPSQPRNPKPQSSSSVQGNDPMSGLGVATGSRSWAHLYRRVKWDTRISQGWHIPEE
ncbi:hypothetical protein BSL78_16972 [Apostichopus japonicus]|uniref:CCHC-type domain-containing protein n=1 Tax=Stichopus japonicus TaxID=307972 RepID=A0A2G8KDS6_STIJA|nr:hypothetical protein BSL78_16972 [Apostichopus japonicus]